MWKISLRCFLNKGWVYNHNTRRMSYDIGIAETDNDEPGVRTAKLLNVIANTLEGDIQLTYDVPSMHSDSKMPVLDLKIWCEENRVMYTFYKKDISSKYTILKRSALYNNVKRDTCFMEAIRRILHVSECLPWSHTVKHLNDFSNCMMISGYSQVECYHVIAGAIERVKKIKTEVRNSDRCSLFRDRKTILKC